MKQVSGVRETTGVPGRDEQRWVVRKQNRFFGIFQKEKLSEKCEKSGQNAKTHAPTPRVPFRLARGREATAQRRERFQFKISKSVKSTEFTCLLFSAGKFIAFSRGELARRLE